MVSPYIQHMLLQTLVFQPSYKEANQTTQKCYRLTDAWFSLNHDWTTICFCGVENCWACGLVQCQMNWRLSWGEVHDGCVNMSALICNQLMNRVHTTISWANHSPALWEDPVQLLIERLVQYHYTLGDLLRTRRHSDWWSAPPPLRKRLPCHLGSLLSGGGALLLDGPTAVTPQHLF